MSDIRRTLYRELFQFFATPRVYRGRSVTSSARDLPRPLARSIVHFYHLLQSSRIALLDDELSDQLALSIATWFASIWEPLDEDEIDDRSRERALRRIITPLADHLNEAIPTLVRAHVQCHGVFGVPATWNVFDRAWEELSWDQIIAARETAGEAHGLERMCALVVRGTYDRPRRLVWRTQTVWQTETHEEEAGYGVITGMRGSSGVQLARPDELALLSAAETEDLFARKLADRSVLTLAAQRTRVHSRKVKREEWRQVTAPVLPGPLYLCLDTSGSMRGMPEAISRAAVVTMIREAVPSGRPLTVAAAQDRLSVVRIGVPPDSQRETQSPTIPSAPLIAGAPGHLSETELADVAELFRVPLSGGADISPALEYALATIEADHSHDDASVADILIVTDIRFPRIGSNHLHRVEALQKTGALRLQVLSISELPIEDPMNVFDVRWHYQLNSVDPQDSPGITSDSFRLV
jgi:Mg-chelatase subunit ChlD